MYMSKSLVPGREKIAEILDCVLKPERFESLYLCYNHRDPLISVYAYFSCRYWSHGSLIFFQSHPPKKPSAVVIVTDTATKSCSLHSLGNQLSNNGSIDFLHRTEVEKLLLIADLIMSKFCFCIFESPWRPSWTACGLHWTHKSPGIRLLPGYQSRVTFCQQGKPQSSVFFEI